MKMPISEIADRYSITRLKKERVPEKELGDVDLSKELAAYKSELDQYPDIENFLERLYRINGEIWDLESDIRKGKEGQLGLEEVGRRAIEIRGKNKIRVGIKNEMVALFKEGFEDVKMNHAST